MVNDLRPYGSQRVAASLVQHWSATGSVRVVTLERASDDDLALPEGVTRVAARRAGPRVWALFSLAYQVRRAARRAQPRVVVSHMTLSNVVTLLASVGARWRPVVVEHGILSSSLGVQQGGRVTGALFRRLHRRARLVVGVSDAVVTDLHHRFAVPQARLMRLYNPVPDRSVGNLPPPHPWLARPRDAPTVVCIGGLRRAKGQDVLIDALADQTGAGDRTRAIFVGEGPDGPALLRRAVDRGVADRVLFTGYREDAMAWLRHSDALVMPSRWESFGLVAVEAARFGVPVIATDVPGLREIAGRRAPGWLVPPEDPSRLAVALSRLGNGPPPASEASLGEFDEEVAAIRYLDALGLTRSADTDV